jgi:hypothetical protein
MNRAANGAVLNSRGLKAGAARHAGGAQPQRRIVSASETADAGVPSVKILGHAATGGAAGLQESRDQDARPDCDRATGILTRALTRLHHIERPVMDIARIARDLRNGRRQGDAEANYRSGHSNSEWAFHGVTSDVWSLQRSQRRGADRVFSTTSATVMLLLACCIIFWRYRCNLKAIQRRPSHIVDLAHEYVSTANWKLHKLRFILKQILALQKIAAIRVEPGWVDFDVVVEPQRRLCEAALIIDRTIKG